MLNVCFCVVLCVERAGECPLLPPPSFCVCDFEMRKLGIVCQSIFSFTLSVAFLICDMVGAI